MVPGGDTSVDAARTSARATKRLGLCIVTQALTRAFRQLIGEDSRKRSVSLAGSFFPKCDRRIDPVQFHPGTRWPQHL
jgi:hypothetical protein